MDKNNSKEIENFEGNKKIEYDKFNISKYIFIKIDLIKNIFKVKKVYLEGEIVNFILNPECEIFEVINIKILDNYESNYERIKKKLQTIFHENIKFSINYNNINFFDNGIVSFHEREKIQISIFKNCNDLYYFYLNSPFRNLYNIYISISSDRKILLYYCKMVEGIFNFYLSTKNNKCIRIGYKNPFNKKYQLIRLDNIERLCYNINCNCFLNNNDNLIITGDNLIKCNVFKNNNKIMKDNKIEIYDFSKFCDKYFPLIKNN